MNKDNFCIQLDAILSTSNFGQICTLLVTNCISNGTKLYFKRCTIFVIQLRDIFVPLQEQLVTIRKQICPKLDVLKIASSWMQKLSMVIERVELHAQMTNTPTAACLDEYTPIACNTAVDSDSSLLGV